MPTGFVIPCSEIKSSNGGPVTVDTIEVSAVVIPTVKMKDFNGVFSYASSKAKNVEIEMELSICSTFTGTVCVPWPICCVGVSGGLSISSFTQTSDLGDITMNGGSFCMDSPTVDMGPLSMTIPALGTASKPTTVAKIQVKDIDMQCTEIPMQNPLGITLGDSFEFPNPMGPMNIEIDGMQMCELDSTAISTPAATAKNIKALNINIPSVKTKPINIVSSTAMSVSMSMPLYNDGSAMGKKVTTTGSANCGKIESNVTLNVSSVTLRIKCGLEFTDVQGKVVTSSADSAPFDIDLNLKGLKVKGLNILGLSMPELEVELRVKARKKGYQSP